MTSVSTPPATGSGSLLAAGGRDPAARPDRDEAPAPGR